MNSTLARMIYVKLSLLALVLVMAVRPAVAQEHESFTQERFETLQSENDLILLDVYADWCPTCARQQEILQAYQEAHPDVPLHILRIDFDDQKNWVKEFKAPRQSTLILYRGNERLWFSVAETDAETVFEALNQAASSS